MIHKMFICYYKLIIKWQHIIFFYFYQCFTKKFSNSCPYSDSLTIRLAHFQVRNLQSSPQGMGKNYYYTQMSFGLRGTTFIIIKYFKQFKKQREILNWDPRLIRWILVTLFNYLVLKLYPFIQNIPFYTWKTFKR